MRSLPLRPSLAVIAACLASTPALAQTTVNTVTTTPLATSSAGDISITTDGQIVLSSGTAVTVNSNNSINNAGAIALTASGDNAAGIVVTAGRTSGINNSGAIVLLENYVRPNANSPIASASNRFGIHLLSGGAMNGSISHTGAISLEGRNSGGIVLDSTLNGSLTSSGAISVVGENSYGIKTGAVTGDVTISNGNISVYGNGATALAVLGDVGGKVSIQGVVQQGITFADDDNNTLTLLSPDINAGAPAAQIAGNVAGGISVLGLLSTDTGAPTGTITAYGNGPGLLIGGTTNSVIGPVAGDGHSVVIAGTVTGNATYNGLNAFGIVVGGKGGNVSLPGGISVSGTVTAAGSNSAATAIQINSGSTVPSLTNTGLISTSMITAGTTATPGTSTNYGIQDLSGSLTSVENMGSINVAGGTGDVRRAIDLSANTTGVTISQRASSATSPPIPTIFGDILTGSGNDTLSVTTGLITGNSFFNAGNDQLLLSGNTVFQGNANFGTGAATLALSNTAKLTGTVDFGGGTGTFSIADTGLFNGMVTNGANIAVAVTGGAFAANATGDIALNSLAVGAGGTISAHLDGATQLSSRFVLNSATFDSGAKLIVSLSSPAKVLGNYTILTANTITGQLDTTTLGLPFLLNGAVTRTGNNLILNISRKNATDLGLNRATASAFNAILNSTANDATLTENLFSATDAATVKPLLAQLLPDHSGGVFDATTHASRLTTQHLMDGDSLYTISQFGLWFEPIYWRGGQDSANVAPYSDNGWGLTLGAERITSLGRVGLSFSLLKSSVSNEGGIGKVSTSQNEFGLFWRVQKGPFYIFARGGAAPLSMSGTRTFTGTSAGAALTKTMTGKWHGYLFSGTGGMSLDANLGDRFTVRPKAVIDYYRLQENAYTETGGTAGMNLTVAKRTSSVVSGTATLTALYRLSPPRREGRPLTLALEVGRRNRLSGSLGDTVANFVGGTPFTITPDKVQNAWVGEASVFAGGLDYTFKLGGRAERSADGKMGYSGRFSFSGAF